jgi:hypothetical protein
MHFYAVAAILNVIASFADGYTTQMAIKVGDVEGNKVLSFVYGTNRPDGAQEYGIGGAIELGEIAAYLALYHFAGVSLWVFSALALAEMSVHIACAISNYRLAKTGKALFTL